MNDVQEPGQIYPRKNKFEDEIELIDYLRVMWKWKWLIVGGTVLCILAASAYAFTSPVVKMYKVSALIEIDPEAKLDPSDKIKSMIEYGIFNQQVLKELSKLQGRGISNPESLAFEVAIPKGLDVLDIAYKTQDPDLGKAVLNSLVKQLEHEYSQKTRYQFEKKLSEISMQIFKVEALNEEIRLVKNRIAQTKKMLQEAQSSSNRLSTKRETTLPDSNDTIRYINIFVHAYPLVLREWIDRLVSEQNSISAKIMFEIGTTKNLAVGIKSLKIAGGLNFGDEENFVLRLKSEIDSLKRGRDKITGVIIKQAATASLLPTKYKAKRNALLAGTAGFFFSIFLAFFIEYIKNASKPTQKAV